MGPARGRPAGVRAALALAAAAPFAAALFALAAPAAAADSLRIEHQPVRCVVAGKYPQLEACFEPSPHVARARVYFKPEGGPEWYYVEMKPEAECFRGTLPRPKKSLKRMRYYVAVTDEDFAESRTEEYAADVVDDSKSCTIGAVAPYVTTASVLVSGAAALPAGFAGAGVLAGINTTAAVAGAAVVGAGTAGAVIAGGGSEDATTTTRPQPPLTTTSTTTTTTEPPRPPTTTTTTEPGRPIPTTTTTSSTTSTTSTTTTTTTLPSACGTDSGPPEVEIVRPEDNGEIGAEVLVRVDARDPGPVSNGIRQVVISADEQGGRRTAAIATLTGPGPSFEALWVVPPCDGPQDRWYIDARATDGCDRSATDRISVRRRSSSCQSSASAPAPAAPDSGARALVWTSELLVSGGRGQVIANGGDVLFPGSGRSELMLPVRVGRNSVEAVLVDGSGAGTWRFTLASGTIVHGSLRVVAGEVVAAGADTVAFRLRGRPGERAVFAFEATGGQVSN